MARSPAQPETRRCEVCSQPFEAVGKRLICGREKCQKDRWRIFAIKREARRSAEQEGRCRTGGCLHTPLPGLPWCETHQWRKDPCKRCLGERGRVRKNPGWVGQPELCDPCRGVANDPPNLARALAECDDQAGA